jgi:hypothetical protein
MSAEKKKPFSQKHDPDLRPDPRIAKEIEKRSEKQEIPCALAFEIAEGLNATPMDVGLTADLMNIKVVKCQLGLFGYKPRNKIVKAEAAPDPALRDAVTEASESNRLACEKAWQIADRLNVGKLKVGNASQANGFKIKRCQLGAF